MFRGFGAGHAPHLDGIVCGIRMFIFINNLR